MGTTPLNPAEMIAMWSEELDKAVKERDKTPNGRLRHDLTHRIVGIRTNIKYYQQKLVKKDYQI